MALNGGPAFDFNQAVSFMVHCKDQAEVDYFWEKLGEGGDASKQACGWVSDKYGMSWQIVPDGMIQMTGSDDKEAARRAFTAMMGMTKLDVEALWKAFRGE